MGKYHVEFRAFESGEWYQKDSTSDLQRAQNWKYYSCGRDVRIIKASTGAVISFYPGDSSEYERLGKRK